MHASGTVDKHPDHARHFCTLLTHNSATELKFGPITSSRTIHHLKSEALEHACMGCNLVSPAMHVPQPLCAHGKLERHLRPDGKGSLQRWRKSPTCQHGLEGPLGGQRELLPGGHAEGHIGVHAHRMRSHSQLPPNRRLARLPCAGHHAVSLPPCIGRVQEGFQHAPGEQHVMHGIWLCRGASPSPETSAPCKCSPRPLCYLQTYPTGLLEPN